MSFSYESDRTFATLRVSDRVFQTPYYLSDDFCKRSKVVGAKRRRRTTAADFFDAIGERVQLARLRQVPAFGRFEQELRTALLELNYLSEETQ